MLKCLFSILIVFAGSGAAMAVEWARYQNERFGYEIMLPPGFPMIREADNSDGGRSSSPNGDAELKVWGTNLLDTPFAKEITSRIAGDAGDGWAISYRSVKPGAAAWSGKSGDRILYVRAIPVCTDQAAFLQIEYDAASKAEYDRVVSRLAGSLRQFVTCQ